jgi:hypothetical protein
MSGLKESTMSLANKFTTLSLLILALAPVTSQATAARGYTTDEIAVQKVSEAVVVNDLKFVTTSTENICGNTGVAGTDVKVQVAAIDGRFITIRHYGVTSAGFFTSEKAIECSK